MEKALANLKIPDLPGTNKPFHVYLNDRRNEFLSFTDESFVIPKISVHGLTLEQKLDLTAQIARLIPEYLTGYSILEHPKPVAETMFIHYIKPFSGREYRFVHILKLDMKFAGNPDAIIEKGDNEFYPSYRSDRLYFKSLLVPTASISYDNDRAVDFDPMKLFEKVNIASEEGKFTYALFDDTYSGDITNEILADVGEVTFPFSPKVFPFFYYGYFTACFNVPYPIPKNINKAIKVFEPIFAKLARVHDKDFGIDYSRYADKFTCTEKCGLTTDFLKECDEYFANYSVTHDDDLLLKNWRELNAKNS